ncbi:MAG: hypothetical protein M1828_005890 [Chrysothrix sp. TS-e1954]|nr:MAG: hypothetical protein M1828_005890 [Chrysothrix sp. TS-e1954]
MEGRRPRSTDRDQRNKPTGGKARSPSSISSLDESTELDELDQEQDSRWYLPTKRLLVKVKEYEAGLFWELLSSTACLVDGRGRDPIREGIEESEYTLEALERTAWQLRERRRNRAEQVREGDWEEMRMMHKSLNGLRNSLVDLARTMDELSEAGQQHLQERHIPAFEIERRELMKKIGSLDPEDAGALSRNRNLIHRVNEAVQRMNDLVLHADDESQPKPKTLPRAAGQGQLVQGGSAVRSRTPSSEAGPSRGSRERSTERSQAGSDYRSPSRGSDMSDPKAGKKRRPQY